MAFLLNPIITKFFTNKIESSRPDWGDYLLEVADIFSTFDGEELDRELLSNRFSAISGRSPYVLRDVSNFRDEFGAYGTYLGLYHMEKENNHWKIYLSNAAKHFLCSVEPDVESFCRTQMALFQYPNGAGAAQAASGTVRMQSNIKADTVNEIRNNIRINPLRLVCKIAKVIFEFERVPLDSIEIPYETIFLLMNDDRINTEYSPNNELLYNILTEYKHITLPSWVNAKNNITNFKRNFHIFDRTGLFKHSRNGLIINNSDYERVYTYINVISEMNHDFHGFESCYKSKNLEHDIISVVSSPLWGLYYDSFSMPIQALISLTENILDEQNIVIEELPLHDIKLNEQTFPELKNFQSDQIHTFNISGKTIDPFETIIRREKANREHARILNMIAANLRAFGFSVLENVFIDLYADINDNTYIFEIKSNNTKNSLSQIRKAIAQLYEYRYRSKKNNAILCIILQEKPIQNWVIDYLLNDRNILVCWLVDDLRIECPEQCYNILSKINIVN